jgi:hypothetical protein
MTADVRTVSAIAGGVACPLCHTVAATTEAALAAGADWTCATCHQRWDADRLATVAGYARFVAEFASREHVSGRGSP